MKTASPTVISLALLAAGCVSWALTAPALLADKDSIPPLNPMGVDGSPYGEVFAMAMQTPIDETFHAVWVTGAHDHSGGACEACAKTPHSSGGINLGNLLEKISTAHDLRTNPKPPSEKHRLYLRGQVENKLRFANRLDPAHYANYTSLHFFLTEPELGTHPVLTDAALQLADDTIRYCMAKANDPRPALTAGAAASNVLELMFNNYRSDSPRFTLAQMRHYLATLDQTILRHEEIARQWDAQDAWKNLSTQRIGECNERIRFIRKFRDTAVETIRRFETENPAITP